MAPKKNRKLVTDKKKFELNETNLTSLEQIICPICRSVLIEPVTLPCGHNFCLLCFNGTINNAALVCPVCRTRISIWLRQQKKQSTSNLVNNHLWSIIQMKFRSKVDAKLQGNDCIEDELPQLPKVIATPGEIKKEYLKQREIEENERLAEEERSRDLVVKLQTEEMKLAELEAQKIKRDEELARQLAAAIDEEEQTKQILSQQTPKTSKLGPMDSFIVVLDNCRDKTPKRNLLYGTTRMSFNERRQYLLNDSVKKMERIQNSENDDTIDQEITHIKPINLAPRTPPKFNRCENTIVRTTPVRLQLLQDNNCTTSVIKKSPINLLSLNNSDHKSAFKTTLEHSDFDSSQSATYKRRIDFDNDRLTLNKSPTTPTSPFIGFQSAVTTDCNCSNIFNNMNGTEKQLIIEQQQKLEQLILQERQDLLLAQKLHAELNSDIGANIKKTYELRTPSIRRRQATATATTSSGGSGGGGGSQKRKRQYTIGELTAIKKVKI